MQKTEHFFAKTEISISVADLERYVKGWLSDSEIRQLPPVTVSNCNLIIFLDAGPLGLPAKAP